MQSIHFCYLTGGSFHYSHSAHFIIINAKAFKQWKIEIHKVLKLIIDCLVVFFFLVVFYLLNIILCFTAMIFLVYNYVHYGKMIVGSSIQVNMEGVEQLQTATPVRWRWFVLLYAFKNIMQKVVALQVLPSLFSFPRNRDQCDGCTCDKEAIIYNFSAVRPQIITNNFLWIGFFSGLVAMIQSKTSTC